MTYLHSALARLCGLLVLLFRCELGTFTLSPKSFEELSIVTEGYAPRNPSARVLTVKAGKAADSAERNPTFLERFAKIMKGAWLPDNMQVEDKIDGDGDGAEDYDRICSLLATAYNDISSSWYLNGDASRTAAIVAAIDTFLANLDDVRSGGEGRVAKAGARHSKATIASLKIMKQKTLDHAEAMSKIIDDMLPAEKAAAVDDDPGVALGEKETPTALELDVTAFLASPLEPVNGVIAHKAAGDGPYADTGFRADGLKRYAIGDAERVKAAAKFIAKAANRAQYSAEQLAIVDERIAAAAKKFGVEKAAIEAIAAPVENAQSAVTSDAGASGIALQMLIAEAVAKAAPTVDLTPITAALGALTTRIDADKAELQTQIAKATEAATASEARAANAETTLAALVGKAATASSPGGDAVATEAGHVAPHPVTGQDKTVKATARPEPGGLTPLAAAIHAQRVAAATNA